MGRDLLWGWVSRSSRSLPAPSCIPGRHDFHCPALTGDWVPGVKLGPFSLARTPWGAQAPPQMGEYFRGACLGPGGCDFSRPRESCGPVPRCLQQSSPSVTITGFLKVLFIYWPSRAAQGILILRPAVKHAPLQGELRGVTAGPPGTPLCVIQTSDSQHLRSLSHINLTPPQ